MKSAHTYESHWLHKVIEEDTLKVLKKLEPVYKVYENYLDRKLHEFALKFRLSEVCRPLPTPIQITVQEDIAIVCEQVQGVKSVSFSYDETYLIISIEVVPYYRGLLDYETLMEHEVISDVDCVLKPFINIPYKVINERFTKRLPKHTV